LVNEPKLQRTPTNNPGYDLFETGSDGQIARWIEVKAMTGDWHSRPVGLSRVQFECALKHRSDYWLYVVEHAGQPGQARIVRVQDPARGKTFTFDHGWLAVADESTDAGDP
jgi:hypothetical protein